MIKLGFIGTGTIAAAFIEGLVSSGRRNPILVSPRSQHVARALAARFDTVSLGGSNVAVAEGSDIIFLAMRPAQVEVALRGVVFRPGQIVCSFVTGLSVAELATIAPTASVCRVLPLPAIALGKGPVIHFPRVPEIVSLLSGLGELVMPRHESELVAMGGVSGVMSTVLNLQAALVRWMEGRGVEAASADLYARALFSGLAETALRTPKPLDVLADEHQTKGGLNERTRRCLSESGWFHHVGDALDTVQNISRKELS